MVNRANNAYRFCVALLLIAGIFFLPGGCSDSNNDNDGGDPGNGGGGGISQAVDPNDPLSSVVQIILTNNFGTGSSSIPDYIKALVRARATGVGALNGEFPLTNATSDSVRTIPGISQSVLVRWLDPLSASDDGSTPRFGANNDFIAYFGDGWDSDWEGDAVGSSPNLNGQVDERKVKRAAPGGEEDITFLIAPSRERALLLNKAYMALVKDQSFNLGRDTIISPPVNVHESITNGSTDLADSGQVYYDGRIWLNWDFSEPAVLGLSQ